MAKKHQSTRHTTKPARQQVRHTRRTSTPAPASEPTTAAADDAGDTLAPFAPTVDDAPAAAAAPLTQTLDDDRPAPRGPRVRLDPGIFQDHVLDRLDALDAAVTRLTKGR